MTNPYLETFPDIRQVGRPIFISYQEIEDVMGRPEKIIDLEKPRGAVLLDSKWLNTIMVSAEFPILGRRFVNYMIVVPLWDILNEIAQGPDANYIDRKTSGIYTARRVNWKPGNPLSFHAYALGIDLNWNDNPQGKRIGTIRKHPGIIETFEKNGFIWGGHFTTPDDMHFQSASANVVLPR